MSEKIRITRAAGIVGGATLLSRLCGLGRDIVIASVLGAGLNSDAFLVAFRIPNLLRKLFSEGTLSIAIVPVFSRHLAQHGRKAALALAGSAFHLLTLLLVVGVLCGLALSPAVVAVIAPGFRAVAPKFELTVRLTRLMCPYLFFIGLAALSMGILNALGHFAAPAIAPMFLNLSIIGAAVFLAPHLQMPVTAIALGVLLGGALQLGLQLPVLARYGFSFWKPAPVFHPGLKQIGLRVVPTLFGAAVYQINILIGTVLASRLPEGSVSYLYFADRLVQFPLGVFAVASATAILPSLSRQAALGDYTALQAYFAHGLKMVLFFTLPAMVGLIVLREPLIALLFERGAFDPVSRRLTADALLYYSMGLWAFASERILVSTFFALQDTRTPVKIAAVSVAFNLAAGVALMGPMGHGGLALAVTLASSLHLLLLVGALQRKFGKLAWGAIGASVAKSMTAAALMGLGISRVAPVWTASVGGTTLGAFAGVLGTVALGAVLYGLSACLLKSPEVESLVALARKGRKTT